MAKPLKKIAFTDVNPVFVREILRFAEDHYQFELTTDKDADYVFHSFEGLNVIRYPGVRIFITGENVSPNFMLSDYAISYEKLSFGDRHKWMPLLKIHNRYQPFNSPRPPATEILASKTEFCSYVMSNIKDSNPVRTQIFDLLSTYKKVNSGGKWRNNVGGRVPDKNAFQSMHKFAIAFENCSHPGYLTEKFADAAKANVVPIYWGDPEIGKLFNSEAFINCHDFDSLEDVVERVKQIDNDDVTYLRMLSAPWFPEGVEPEELKDASMAKFLRNIFDQDLHKAYRRNLGRWGIKSEKALYDMYTRPHIHALKQMKKTWRNFYHQIMPRNKKY